VEKRLEYKYLVPINLVQKIRQDIKPYVTLDPYASEQPNKEYTIHSIYLDTKNLDCYKDKVEGIKVRKKYRLRTYNDIENENVVFLEIKRKYNNHVFKNRAPLLRKNLANFLATKDFNFILPSHGNGSIKDDAKRFLYNYFRKGLEPSILIDYDREAFVGKFNNSMRITFDKNIRSALWSSLEFQNNIILKPVMTKFFILEIKFKTGLPNWFKAIVHKYNLQRQALSKYVMSIDAHGSNRTGKKAVQA
jgi:SPX domain protein involved in polyphosphate accumulation